MDYEHSELVVSRFVSGRAYWLVCVDHSRRKWLIDEVKRDAAQEPPSESQLRWDLRHIREDVSILVFVNSVLLWFVAFSIVFGWR